MITNHSKLPHLIIEAIEEVEARYDRGDCDISVTELIGPPRISCLSRSAGSRCDAVDKTYILQGNILHGIVECAAKRNPERYLTEERYFMSFHGWTISGQFDLIDLAEKALIDLKYAAIGTFKFGVKPEYQAQLNVLAYMLRLKGFSFNKLQSLAYYRDWSKMKAFFSPTYKQVPVELYGVEQWSDTKCEDFMRERIDLHRNAREHGPEVCTRAERFQDPDSVDYLVKNPEAKTARKVCKSRKEAETFISELTTKIHYDIVERKNTSEPLRCQLYCDVAHACDYAQDLIQKKIDDTH